jgi:hypothetical protein
MYKYAKVKSAKCYKDLDLPEWAHDKIFEYLLAYYKIRDLKLPFAVINHVQNGNLNTFIVACRDKLFKFELEIQISEQRPKHPIMGENANLCTLHRS